MRRAAFVAHRTRLVFCTPPRGLHPAFLLRSPAPSHPRPTPPAALRVRAHAPFELVRDCVRTRSSGTCAAVQPCVRVRVHVCVCVWWRGAAWRPQVGLLREGRGAEIVQETRTWDEAKLVTTTMRKKEGLADYRCARAGRLAVGSWAVGASLDSMTHSCTLCPPEAALWWTRRELFCVLPALLRCCC